MSIDRFCLVDEKKIYNWMICTEIVEDLQRNGGSAWGNHSVYVMQGGVEYLYIYMEAAHAQADFDEWRGEPLEKIALTLDGIEQPGDRLPLQCACCGQQIPEGHAHVQVDDEDTNSDASNSYCDDCFKTPVGKEKQ